MIVSFHSLRRFGGFCLAFLLAGRFLAVAAEQDATARFDDANLLYEKGRYEEAASAYEALLREVRTAPLHFNAGNAWFKTGRKGQAVVHWLQAAALDPRNERIQINLEFVRNSLSGGVPAPSSWRDHLRRLTLNEWALLTAGAAWVFFGALALGTVRPDWRPGLRGPTVLGLLALVGCGTLLGITASDGAGNVVAVVVADEAVVRFGPLPESQSAFVARDGAELRVTDEKDEWLRVEDTRGREGWLLAEQVIRLRAGREIPKTPASTSTPPLQARVF